MTPKCPDGVDISVWRAALMIGKMAENGVRFKTFSEYMRGDESYCCYIPQKYFYPNWMKDAS